MRLDKKKSSFFVHVSYGDVTYRMLSLYWSAVISSCPLTSMVICSNVSFERDIFFQHSGWELLVSSAVWVKSQHTVVTKLSNL